MLTFISLTSCGSRKDKGDPAYIQSIKEWHNQRIENLKKQNGWLNLVGLYWLKPGKNTFGSDNSNDIIFPKDKAPAFIGSFYLTDDSISIIINTGVNVTNNGKPVKEMSLKDDMTDQPTVLAYSSLRWFIIKRSNKIGIRLRDLNAPLVKEFQDIDTYPIDEDYKVEAKLVPYNPPRIITIASIIGTKEQDTVKAALQFKLKGQTLTVDPVIEGDEYFIIFADKTSGVETYGAGRFLYAPVADSTGKTVLDFNKAYNPPCSFTDYATCPLPPKENYLPIEITAGEKTYHRPD
jgi:uncharacterized protein (DUF1684 family)